MKMWHLNLIGIAFICLTVFLAWFVPWFVEQEYLVKYLNVFALAIALIVSLSLYRKGKLKVIEVDDA